eukprot:gene22190-biopygen17702
MYGGPRRLEKPTKAKLIPNADLWKRAEKLMNNRPPGQTVSQWTKSHALPAHISKKMSTPLDAWGNTAADGLADLAANLNHSICWDKPSDGLRPVP